MEDDLIAKYQIALINSSGQISQAVLYLNEENNTLTLEYSDGRHEVRNENFSGHSVEYEKS